MKPFASVQKFKSFIDFSNKIKQRPSDVTEIDEVLEVGNAISLKILERWTMEMNIK